MTATGPEGTAWSCDWGGAAGGWGQGPHQRAVGMERAAQGSGHGPECFGAFGQCSQTQGLDFGWCCIQPGVGLSDPHGYSPPQGYSMVLFLY